MTSQRIDVDAGTLTDQRPGARPVYFGADDCRCFGWYHAPDESKLRPAAVVLCAPLPQDTTGAPRALRHWAEHLAAEGFAALRFDYPGTGDSSGPTDGQGLVDAWIESVGSAADYVRAESGAESVVFVGVTIGATLALAAAQRRSDVGSIVLWAPSASGRTFLREGRAFTRLMGTSVDAGLPDGAEQIGGFVLSADAVAGLTALDPLASPMGNGLRVLIVPRDETSNESALIRRIAESGLSAERMPLPGYTSMMQEPHRAEVPLDVITGTTRWLAEQDAVVHRATFDRSVRVSRETGVHVAWSDGDRFAEVLETPIRFGAERSLFGILSTPVVSIRRETGVLLLNAGAVSRVGPNGLYVDLARRWSALGYRVLRMDLAGLGDSPPPSGAEENQTYPSHATHDVAQGVAELRARGATRVVVGGLCSGAHASFHSGIDLEGLDGLMLINPIVFYWKPTDPIDVQAWVNYLQSRHYKKSALQWRSWVRLLSRPKDLSRVARISFTRAKEVIRARNKALLRVLVSDGEHEENAARDLKRIVQRGTSVLLLFSEGDPGQDFFMLNHARELRSLLRMPRFHYHTLADADHTFTALDARRRAQEVLTQHLVSTHP